jgi:hypothetical protein
MANEELWSFLQALWPEIPSGQWVNFWGLPSKRSEWTQAFTADTVTMLEQWASKEDVYIACATRRANFGPTFRGERDDCLAIPGLWLDVDYGTGHKKPNLPPTEEAALELIQAMGILPTITLHSGRGIHAWWLFKEPLLMETPEQRADGERLSRGWVGTLRERAKAKGWDADPVQDITRVMRMPGLWNRKSVPIPTKLKTLTEVRYDPSELMDFFLVGTERVDPTPKIGWNFDLTPTAEPPAQKFLLLCDVDHEFKKLCLRIPRPGQTDQSASGFDFQLAKIAFAANWSGQEVVNLLISQRRTHKADLKLRKDYYERTLSQAVGGKQEEVRTQAVNDLKAGKPMPDEVAQDPAEVLAVLSDLFGASITKILKYQGEVGIYEVEINGKSIRLGEINVITSQRAFRNKIADIAGIWFREQGKATWDHTVRMMLQIVEPVEVGQEATMKGAITGMLDGYLSEGVATEDRADEALLQHMPAVKKGVVLFTLTGLRLHIFGQYQERMTSQALSVQLRALGYQSKQEHLVDKRKKHRTTKMVWWRA